MDKQTIEDRARRDALEHFGITEEEFDSIRDNVEGSIFYAKRRLYYAWTDLKREFRNMFTVKQH